MIGDGLDLCTLRADMDDPPWILRGRLYSALAASCCRKDGDGCPACILFTPAHLRRDGRSRQDVRPIVIRRGMTGTEILLFGKAVEHGLKVMSTLGLTGSWIGPQGGPTSSPIAAPLSAWMRPIEGKVLLHILSPLRLEKGSTILTRFDLKVLAQSLSLRLRRMRSSVGDGQWEDDDIDASLREVTAASVTSSYVWRTAVRRYSTRQKQCVWLDGIEGWVTLDNVGAALARLLAAGSLLHVGRGAVMGCGWVQAAERDSRDPMREARC
jgi:hypothetical protein